MPKRPSLVGTAREAIGEPPLESPKPVPTKRLRPAAKAGKAAEPAAAAPPLPPEPRPAAVASPATAYEAMMSFASAALRQNMETGARLARCKSPLEVLAAQTAHAAALAQSFFAISMRLMQLSLSAEAWRRRV